MECPKCLTQIAKAICLNQKYPIILAEATLSYFGNCPKIDLKYKIFSLILCQTVSIKLLCNELDNL